MLPITQAQFQSEVERVAESGCFYPADWMNVDVKAYFTLDRTGADFALTRREKAVLAPVLHAAVQQRLKQQKPEGFWRGVDYEGMLLERQEREMH